MKRLITKAPLFLATCISLVVMFILTQFIEPLRTYFPGFSDDVDQITIGAQDFSNFIDTALINPRRTQNTIYVAANDNPNLFRVDDGDLQPEIYSIAEDPPEEVEPAFIPIESEPLVPTPRASEHGAKSLGPVTESYFDDAVFIGDSRTVGLSMYSAFENADYLCDVGMNIYDCLDRDIDFKGNSHTSVRNMLATHTYKKVYIILGINDMGIGNSDTFIGQYEEVVSKIREWQPDAVIYVNGILKVSAERNAQGGSINNKDISARNERIKALANGYDIVYLDPNEVLCDENGNLRAEWTFDGVHLYAKDLYHWTDYIKDHAFMKKPYQVHKLGNN